MIKTYDIKKDIINKQIENRSSILDSFNKNIIKKPKIFNIETTNICNMKCKMCPRTELMTRKLMHMEKEVFDLVLEEVQAYRAEEFNDWLSFVENTLNIPLDEKSENAFYFYASSKCVTLHGYGEPVLDPFIINRIESLTKKNVPTYFSCNPVNIKYDFIKKIFDAGLTNIKFSLDSIFDDKQKYYRGSHSDFTNSFKRVLDVIDIKKKNNYDTKIVVVKIDLEKYSKEENKKFLEIFNNEDVYAYIKSQDNKWYFEDEDTENKSHYVDQYCEFPCTSLSIMADGSVVPCTQDYNLELKFGNIKENSLEEIWNSTKYNDFREMHITGKFPKNFKCAERCDLKQVNDYC